MRLKVRSLVGLLPLCATTVVPMEFFQRFPKFIERAQKRFEKQPELVANIQDPREAGYADRRLFSILDADKLRRETGWAPEFSLDQTLRDTLEHWRLSLVP